MTATRERRVVDFAAPDAAAAWRSLDDVVMGGVSSSRVVRVADGVGCFEGVVSLEHGGGFASARTTLAAGTRLAGRAIAARVRGDGRRYQLRLRTDDTPDGVSYRAALDAPAGEWRTVVLPFSSFVPTRRGRAVANAPALDPSRVRQVGFLIADRQAGPFALEIEWLATCDRADQEEDR